MISKPKFSRKGNTLHSEGNKELYVILGKGVKKFKTINAAKRESRMLSVKFGHCINLSK